MAPWTTVHLCSHARNTAVNEAFIDARLTEQVTPSPSAEAATSIVPSLGGATCAQKCSPHHGALSKIMELVHYAATLMGDEGTKFVQEAEALVEAEPLTVLSRCAPVQQHGGGSRPRLTP